MTNLHPLYHRLGYTPHPGQHAFHVSAARFKVLIAGARFGKSLAAAREVLPDIVRGDTRGWIVAPSYRLGEKEFRYLYADLRQLGVELVRSQLGGARGSSHLITRDDAEVLVISAAEAHNLLGEELDWVLLSEASQLSEEVWTRYLRARLSTRIGRLIVPTTPKGTNWIKPLYLRGLDPAFPDWAGFHYATADNPLIPRAEVEDARRTLPERDFREQYLGEFTLKTGLVYDDFSVEAHTLEALPELTGELLVGVDFGYTNPFAMVFARLDGLGRLVVIDEYYQRKQVTNAHVEALMARVSGEAARVVVDPSAPALIAELNAQGVRVESANNRVLEGIDRVRVRLVTRIDGRPALMISRRCTNLIDEFTRYAWAKEGEDEGFPAKAHDHALDALRYLVAMVDRGQRADQIR